MMNDGVGFQSVSVCGLLCEPLISYPKEDGLYIEGLVQERRNASALAMVLYISCINPLT